MNKKEFITALAQELGTTKVDSERFLDAFQEIVMTTVADGGVVKLTGFGSWESTERAAREGRNPMTGESLQIAGKVVPRFKFGKIFKNRVAKI